MGRTKINVILLIILKLFLVGTTTGDETCENDREMDKLCGGHTYKSVKPLLDYFKQVRNELDQSEIKEKHISEINADLMIKYHEIVAIHEKLMKEAFQLDEYKNKIIRKENDLQLCQSKVDKLESEINLQQTTINKLTLNANFLESYDECKKELSDISNNLEICEVQLKKLNSSVIEKDEKISGYSATIQNITEHQKTISLKLEKRQTMLFKKDKDIEICHAEIVKLNRTSHNNNIPSSCLPFGYQPGVHEIKVSGVDSFDVLCDSQLAGPGWIVIQQRIGGEEDFGRDWATYRKGFGSLDSDFFLGLEKIHRLTSQQQYELYIHLVAEDGSIFYARYDDFKISDEDHGYSLSLGKFKGNIWDAMREHENMKFTTFDRDNDSDSYDNCAVLYKSGWWYNRCFDCNLNGLYGVTLKWRTRSVNILKEAKMLIRPKDKKK
ncbi:fibrinogen-like protein 1 isoform X3 [Drosophila sulfurigaster albostrigata]|uniref:fibrinogen-like protein 1 isoform X3 n=1 Tax=Drosophila sulfurigaster albostrigata TaxID=89887 RepID=UPI002D21AC25|nr:fibrinogen-like protein 1 isoform X3 [Drosophila sulfurigaster albostrigata]